MQIIWATQRVNQTCGDKYKFFQIKMSSKREVFQKYMFLQNTGSFNNKGWFTCPAGKGIVFLQIKRGVRKSSYLRKVRRQRWYCNVIPSQERSNKSLLDFNSVDCIILISIIITWSSYYISNSMWCLLSHGTQHRIRHFMLSKHCKIQNTMRCKLNSAQQNISNLWCKSYSTNSTHYQKHSPLFGEILQDGGCPSLLEGSCALDLVHVSLHSLATYVLL